MVVEVVSKLPVESEAPKLVLPVPSLYSDSFPPLNVSFTVPSQDSALTKSNTNFVSEVPRLDYNSYHHFSNLSI